MLLQKYLKPKVFKNTKYLKPKVFKSTIQALKNQNT